MSDQRTLFTPLAAAAETLTGRQRLVLELVQHAGRHGIRPDQVGAQLCARRGKHPAEDRCQWCGTGGLEVLRALRRKGHVKARRDGSWHPTQHAATEPRPAGHDPFPEGF